MLRSVWKVLCFVLLGVFIQRVRSECGNVELNQNSGQIVVNETCTMLSATINASSPLFVYMSSGVIGPGDDCTVWEVEDGVQGDVLGTFIGYGNELGAVRSSTNQIRLVCNLVLAHTELVFSYQLVLFDDCGESISVLTLPRDVASPNDPMSTIFYPHCAMCVWEFRSFGEACNYTFNIGRIEFNRNDFLFFNWGDGETEAEGDATRIGNHTRTIFSADPQYNLVGNQVRVMFVSDGSAGGDEGFQMEVSADCPTLVPGIQCSEHPLIILGSDDLEQLNATAGDTLYIAPSWDTKPDEVDPACVTNVDDPFFSFNITQCVPIAENRDDKIFLSYVVWNAKYLDLSNPVQRYRIFSINYTCEFAATELLSSTELHPFIERIGVFADPVEAEFEIKLELYESEDFENKLEDGDSVVVASQICGEVRLCDLPDTTDNFQIEMTDCWATPVESFDATPAYPIVDESCKAMNDFDYPGTIELIRNAEPLFGQFCFKSFVWTNVSDVEQAIYVHCAVTVCDREAGACSPGCGEDLSGSGSGSGSGDVGGTGTTGTGSVRRRRDVQILGDTQRYSAGPIIITPKRSPSAPQVDGEDLKKILHEYQDLVEHQQSYNQELTAMLAVAILIVVCILVIRRQN